MWEPQLLGTGICVRRAPVKEELERKFMFITSCGGTTLCMKNEPVLYEGIGEISFIFLFLQL